MANFGAPIPGESLTREPGNAPWEQPPQFAGVDEATQFYLSKFEDDDTLEDALWVLDQGCPLDLFVESMLLYGEMEGRHTFDTSFIIAPILHEYLLAMAEAAGVNVKEFQGKSGSDRQKEKLINDLQMKLGSAEDNTVADEVVEVLPEAVDKVAQQPKGIMRKPNG